jgi:hypothetical protein
VSSLSANPGYPPSGGTPLPAKPLGVLALAFLVLFIDGYDLFTLGTVGPSLLRHGAWGDEITPGTLGVLGSVTGIGMIEAGFYAFTVPAVFGAVAVAFLPKARAPERTRVPLAAAPDPR